jgi:F-type H+-transporting ATPase subunit b
MNAPFFLAAAAAPDAGGGMVQEIAKTFGWTPQLFFSQVVVFLIVAFLLKKFAFKPVMEMLEKRRQTIEQGLKHAEQMKQELAQAQAKAQEVIGQAGAQATKIIEEARAAAAKVQEAETQKAIAAAADLIAKAKEANSLELARMKTELRAEIGRLVVDTTAKVSGKILTFEDRQRIAGDAVRDLAA